LEDYPEHVRAIGMISIENANLDYELADLFVNRLPNLTPDRRPILTPSGDGFWR
jgi:hypothetical protein